MRAKVAVTLLLSTGFLACREAPREVPASAASASGAPVASAAPVTPAPPKIAPAAGALVPSARGDALLVADEDHHALRVVPLPLDPSAPRREIALPGAPAQVLAAGDRVLVTVRDPGLLVVLAAATLEEIGRVPVAADAWGLAITPDARTAIVTSAWTRSVAVVDLGSLAVRATLDVAREPRGVAVHPDGKRAYVTHLVGSALTRLDGLDATPSAQILSFPASPLRAHAGAPDAASLGYAAAFSADGSRLFVPRQALNADGKAPWNGQPTVDVLLTARDEPLAQRPARGVKFDSKEVDEAVRIGTGRGPFEDVSFTGGIANLEPVFAQPRAVVLRRSTRTLLVASEGTDALVELDALAVEPAGKALRTYDLGYERAVPKPGHRFAVVLRDHRNNSYSLRLDDGTRTVGYHRVPVQRRLQAGERVSYAPPRNAAEKMGSIDELLAFPGKHAGDTRCGAPSGVALSADESTAYVWCRSSGDLAVVPLERHDGSPPRVDEPLTLVHLADDPLPREAALGRRLFYNGRDLMLSEGFGCAGCHPEGRADGHVWRERVPEPESDEEAAKERNNESLHEPGQSYQAFPAPFLNPFQFPFIDPAKRHPRKTPLLAGRVAAKGPYGWHGKTPDLVSRILRGASIHRWPIRGADDIGTRRERAAAIAAFLRAGLVPPPQPKRALTAEEERGKGIFESPAAGCAGCHVPASGFTDRSVIPMPPPKTRYDKNGPLPGDDEPNRWFKTPSLLYLSGAAPYFHDGSALTLEQLVEENADRMGKTRHLSAEERAALVAYLKTL